MISGGASDRDPGLDRAQDSLLLAYRSGEREALRVVESWIRSAVARSAWELSRDRADVVQEVHLRLLTNLDRGSFRGESTFKSYVCGVTKYTSIGLVRNKRKYLPLPLGEPERLSTPCAGPEQRLAARERISQVASALERLPIEQRRLFQLIYRQGLDYETVGRMLGVATGTVKSRASRFRSALTRRLSSAAAGTKRAVPHRARSRA